MRTAPARPLARHARYTADQATAQRARRPLCAKMMGRGVATRSVAKDNAVRQTWSRYLDRGHSALTTCSTGQRIHVHTRVIQDLNRTESDGVTWWVTPWRWLVAGARPSHALPQSLGIQQETRIIHATEHSTPSALSSASEASPNSGRTCVV